MANELEMLMVEFHGTASFPEEQDFEIEFGDVEPRRHRKEIDVLNRNSSEIAREIQRELRRVLPPSVNVQVQIGFEEGSLTWSGVILLIQAMGMVVDFVGFTEITKKLAEITIDRIVRRWVYGVNRQIQFDEPTNIVIVTPSTSNRSSEATAQFRMARLLMYNTILVAILLFIQLLPFFQSIIAFLQSNNP